MRKTIYIIRYCVAAALTLAATSCVKDELHDTPQRGRGYPRGVDSDNG